MNIQYHAWCCCWTKYFPRHLVLSSAISSPNRARTLWLGTDRKCIYYKKLFSDFEFVLIPYAACFMGLKQFIFLPLIVTQDVFTLRIDNIKNGYPYEYTRCRRGGDFLNRLAEWRQDRLWQKDR